jgi:Dullard-like phosphatase family protein
MNHDSYLLLCDFISNKISSKEKENIWVKKLRLMLNNNLFHLNLNNEQYVSYLMSKNFSLNIDDDNKNSFLKSLYELKYYIFTIEKYIKILLNYFYDQKLKVGFIDIFQNLKDRNMTIEKLNLFFFTKVLRIINKNASVGGAGASMYGTDNDRQKYEKVPYLEYPCPKKFSLILDLDETLISFKIDESQQNKGILKFRPGLDEFLKSVKQNYEIIVFTSATQQYADPIENEIENNIKYFDVRLYRQHTIIHDNHFVKDISRIGRPLDKILIVDNMPQNYKLQKENGIMIKPFWGEDNDDTTLLSLAIILNKIAENFDDVRKGISFYKDDILNKISSNFSRKENENMKFEI